jgi:TRAP transporter TAXI family solute receptor
MRNPYESLAVPRTATADVAKRSFRQLAKKPHPDISKNYPSAAALFAERCLARLLWVTAILLLTMMAASAETQLDPASVSESLKAIFRYGSKETAERLNANTVTLMSGTIGGTYVQFGADLESVLDDGDNLRILTIVGRGSVQSIADILFLKGVDLGIVRSDTLEYLERKGYANNIHRQLNYITKLYNEEMHVVAPKSIHSLTDLEGKRVAVDLPNGGTFVTAITVFERLGIHPQYQYVEQRVAYDQLSKGELDAVVAVQGKPSRATTLIKDNDLHLVPIEYAKPLQSDYLPAQLTADDYPNLIAKDKTIDTIAVPAVLASYNWTSDNDRYRRLSLFVDAFFSKIDQLRQPPFHPKWKEVVLGAPLPGWTRFPPAQEWLERMKAEQDKRKQTDQQLSADFKTYLNTRSDLSSSHDPALREALYRDFLRWHEHQGAK